MVIKIGTGRADVREPKKPADADLQRLYYLSEHPEQKVIYIWKQFPCHSNQKVYRYFFEGHR